MVSLPRRGSMTHTSSPPGIVSRMLDPETVYNNYQKNMFSPSSPNQDEDQNETPTKKDPSPTTTTAMHSSSSPPINSAEAAHINDLQFEVTNLLGRLKRRNLVIDAIRKAYLRDVVTVKHELMKKWEDPATYDGASQTQVVDHLPSLDLRPTLELFAPAECSLRVKPCEGCGGQLEVVHRESKKVEQLTKKCTDLMKIEQDVRLKASRMEIQASRDRRSLDEQRLKNVADREVFLRQISALRVQLGMVSAESFEAMRKRCMVLEKATLGNEGKLNLFDEMQTQLKAMQEEVAAMRAASEANNISMRETEHLRSEANDEKDEALQGAAEAKALFEKEQHDNEDLRAKIKTLEEEAVRTKEKNGRVQQLLDESRKNEAYLKQKMSAADTESREALEAEQQNQEASEKKVEETRDELRSKKELEKYVKMYNKTVKDYGEKTEKEITSKVEEAEGELKKQFQDTISGLTKQLKDATDGLSKTEKKLGIEQKMRMQAETKLKSKSGTAPEEEEEAKGEEKKDESSSVSHPVPVLVKKPASVKDVDEEASKRRDEEKTQADLEKASLQALKDEVDALKMQLAKQKSAVDDQEVVGKLEAELNALRAELEKCQMELELAQLELKATSKSPTAVGPTQEEYDLLHTRMVALTEKAAGQEQMEVAHNAEELEDQKKLTFEERERAEKLQAQVSDMQEGLAKQQMEVDILKSQASDPGAGEKLKEELDLKVAKLMDQKDADFALQRSIMEEEVKKYKVIAENNSSAKRKSPRTEDFGEVPILQEQVEGLQEDVSMLKEAMCGAITRGNLDDEKEIAVHVEEKTERSTKMAQMMREMATLKAENLDLHGDTDGNEMDKMEKEMMKEENSSLKNKLKSAKEKIFDLEADLFAASSGGVSMEAQLRLKQDMEDQKATDDQHKAILTKSYDRVKLQLLGMCGTLTDVIIKQEDILSKDAVDVVVPGVDETLKGLVAVAKTLDFGTEITIVELGNCMKTEAEIDKIVEYLENRIRLGQKVCSDQLAALRDTRDNSPPPSAPGFPKMKLDMAARQKEFRLTKKAEEAERKLQLLKDDSTKTKAGLVKQLEVSVDRADNAERNLKKANQDIQSMHPKIKQYDQLKADYTKQEIHTFKIDSELAGVTKDLAMKVTQLKSSQAEEFKFKIKIKGQLNKIEENADEIVSLKLCIKNLEKTLEDARKVHTDLLQVGIDRLNSNVSVECQFSPPQESIDCQTDFVGKEVTLRQSTKFANTMWASPVVNVALTEKVVRVNRMAAKMSLGMSKSVVAREQMMGQSTGMEPPMVSPSLPMIHRGGGGVGGGGVRMNSTGSLLNESLGYDDIDAMRKQLRSAGNAPRQRR